MQTFHEIEEDLGRPEIRNRLEELSFFCVSFLFAFDGSRGEFHEFMASDFGEAKRRQRLRTSLQRWVLLTSVLCPTAFGLADVLFGF